MKNILVIEQKDTKEQWFINIVGENYFQIGLQVVLTFADKRNYRKCGQDDLLFTFDGKCSFKAMGHNNQNEKMIVEFESYFHNCIEIDSDWDEPDLSFNRVLA